MINLSFIIKICKDTNNLSQILQNLKEYITEGDEIIFYINSSDITDENIKIINKYESIYKKYNKFSKTIVIPLIKVFSYSESDIDKICTHPIKCNFNLNTSKNQIDILRQ
jgi:hypothetical protein